MKKLFLILIALSTPFFSSCNRPKGFTLKKVTSQHSNHPEWDVAPPEDMQTIVELLNQPYTYLGSGNHCYAFISSDGSAVLKLFKQKHMRTQSFLDIFPARIKQALYPKRRLERRMKERKESFASYKIAYERLRKETGLLYIHLNKTKGELPHISLIDQHHTSHQVDLDEMEFLLQRKATLAFNHLSTLLSNPDTLLEAVESLLRVVATRSAKKIFDRDLQFYKNFGFLGNRAIEVDVGEFKLDIPSPSPFEEVLEVSNQINEFIEENAPNLQKTVQTKIDSILESLQ